MKIKQLLEAVAKLHTSENLLLQLKSFRDFGTAKNCIVKYTLLSAALCIFFLFCNVRIAKAEVEMPKDFNKITETANLGLYYNEKEAAIIVRDLNNNFLWYSSVNSEKCDTSKLNDQWKGNVRSLFNINYTNVKKNDGAVIASSSVALAPKITTKNIKNGISLNYNFLTLKISLALNITLENDSLNVSIPADSIKEEGDMGITSLEILPFFGAALDNEDGYIFYPDGSGALLKFKDPSHYGLKRKSWNVYGNDAADYVNDTNNQQMMLPVFGIKQGENAFVAILTEGENDALINLTPTGNVVDLNRISPEFTFRHYSIDPRTKKTIVRRYDKSFSNINHSVKYTLLDKNNADYSGMANAYRNYILNSEKAIKRIESKDKIPLGIDLFMGISEKRLFIDKFIAMTTFNQAESILGKFKSSGVDNIYTNLIGWTKKGYGTEPLQFPPNNALGGEKGLKKFASFTKDNGIKLYLQANLIDAIDKYDDFSKRNDVVYQGNGLILTSFNKDSFIFSPFTIIERFTKNFMPQAKQYAINGINFQGMGSLAYYDYNKAHPATRTECTAYWNDIMNKSSKEFGESSTTGGNAYTFKNSNRLFEIPDKDTGYYFTTEAVPFYQMVVHGLIPYSSDAGNLSNDFSREKLKWVEYGYMPYFELTYNSPGNLKYTAYNQLFTSSYSEWVDTASKVYKEFNEKLGDVWSHCITKHEKVQEDVFKITYDNDMKIYVNYKSETVSVDGFNVKALDYIVVDKGGKTK